MNKKKNNVLVIIVVFILLFIILLCNYYVYNYNMLFQYNKNVKAKVIEL